MEGDSCRTYRLVYVGPQKKVSVPIIFRIYDGRFYWDDLMSTLGPARNSNTSAVLQGDTNCLSTIPSPWSTRVAYSGNLNLNMASINTTQIGRLLSCKTLPLQSTNNIPYSTSIDFSPVATHS